MIVGSLLVMSALGMGVEPDRLRSTRWSPAGYWCYGTQLSVFASTTADFYGTRYLGMNYGALFTAWGVAGIVGPFIAARGTQATGSYRTRSTARPDSRSSRSSRCRSRARHFERAGDSEPASLT